jgi:hypothetical protein
MILFTQGLVGLQGMHVQDISAQTGVDASYLGLFLHDIEL